MHRGAPTTRKSRCVLSHCEATTTGTAAIFNEAFYLISSSRTVDRVLIASPLMALTNLKFHNGEYLYKLIFMNCVFFISNS